MSRPLMWVGVAYTLGVIWAAGDQKLFYGTAGIVLFVWITGRIRQPWKEKRLFWLLPVFFVSGFVIFDHAMTDVEDASMENQFIHTRGMICQSEAKEKTLAVTLSDADINGRKKKLLLYMEKDAPVAVGDDIEVRGILEKPERASNPGQFDGASYYRSKGIAYIMRPDGYTIVGKGNSYPALLDKIKKFWCGRYQSFLNEEDAGVVRAVLTGDKAEMDEKTEQLYIQAGIVHMLAISGVKTLKLDIPLVPETRIKWAFMPLHIAKIYILKLCLDEEIIPRCRFPCSRGYLTKCINQQKKQ